MSLKLSYNGIPATEIKAFLEEKYLQYNNPSFIECDPISIPHSFTESNDREISGFLDGFNCLGTQRSHSEKQQVNAGING